MSYHNRQDPGDEFRLAGVGIFILLIYLASNQSCMQACRGLL